MNRRICKQHSCRFYSLLFILLLLASRAFSEEIIPVRVGYYENPPKIYSGADGRPAGFLAELVTHIAAEKGWKLTWIHGQWTELLESLEAGKIDMMPDVAFSSERLERFLFNREDIFINWGVVYSRKRFHPQSFFDLNGKRVAGLKGGIHTAGRTGIVNLAKSFGINIELIETETYQEAFELIHRGEADAAVVNRIFGSSHEKNYDINRSSIVFNPVSIRCAFPRTSTLAPVLIADLDNALEEYRKNTDSIYYKLLDTYLTRYIESKAFIPLWILLLLALSLLFAVILAVFLLRLHREITRRIQTETQLRLARNEAERANMAKTVFLASMTHEIRTPLNAVLGYSELLQRSPGLTAEHKRKLKAINSSGELLLSLINEVLDMSRMESGKISYSESDFNPRRLLQDCVDQIRPAAEQGNHHLLLTTDNAVPEFIKADELKVRQVLLNLLNNAAKYADPGPVEVSCRLSSESSDLMYVDVKDYGPGIKETERERIFGIFEKGESNSSSIQGVGLGLALSRRYARFLRGDLVHAENASGGSTFTFSFAFRQGEGCPGYPDCSGQGVSGIINNGKPVKILIVDDREANLDILREMLVSVGFTVKSAKSGSECIDSVTAYEPACILMDILMPGMNGIEATRLLQNHALRDTFKIVALSASALPEHREEILEAGADAFLYKPYRQQELLETIAGLLEIKYSYESREEKIRPETEGPLILNEESRSALIEAARFGSRKDILPLTGKGVPHTLAAKIRQLAAEYRFKEIIHLLEDNKKEETDGK